MDFFFFFLWMLNPSLQTRFTPTCTNRRNFEPWLLKTIVEDHRIWLVRFACDKESLSNHIPSYCRRGYYPDGIFQSMWNKFRVIGKQSIYCVRGYLFFFFGTFCARRTVEYLVICFSEKGSRVEKMSFPPKTSFINLSCSFSLVCPPQDLCKTAETSHHLSVWVQVYSGELRLSADTNI